MLSYTDAGTPAHAHVPYKEYIEREPRPEGCLPQFLLDIYLYIYFYFHHWRKQTLCFQVGVLDVTSFENCNRISKDMNNIYVHSLYWIF